MPCEVLQAFGLFSVVYAIEIVAIGYVCLRRPHAIVRRCVYDCGYMVCVITTIRIDERQIGTVAVEHAPHDLGVDLLGTLPEVELVVHVPRPLHRAHPHHRPLRCR